MKGLLWKWEAHCNNALKSISHPSNVGMFSVPPPLIVWFISAFQKFPPWSPERRRRSIWESFASFHNNPQHIPTHPKFSLTFASKQGRKIESNRYRGGKKPNEACNLCAILKKKRKAHIWTHTIWTTYIDLHTVIAAASYGSVICQHIVCVGFFSRPDNGATIPRDEIPKKWPLKHRVHSNAFSPMCVNASKAVTIGPVCISGRWLHAFWKMRKSAAAGNSICKEREINKIGSLKSWKGIFFSPLKGLWDSVYMQQAGGGSSEEACWVYNLLRFHINDTWRISLGLCNYTCDGNRCKRTAR